MTLFVSLLRTSSHVGSYAILACVLATSSAQNPWDEEGVMDVALLQHAHVLESDRQPSVNASQAGWRQVLTYVGSAELSAGVDKYGQPSEENVDVYGQPSEEHSQAGQDWLVASILSCKREGYFVDLAANDPVWLSNTLMLERLFDWSGLCIEANPTYQLGLAQRRCDTIIAAVGSPSDTEVNFTFGGAQGGLFGGIVSNDTDNTPGEFGGIVSNTLNSLFSKPVKMRTIGLGAILDKVGSPSVIDYLSLDVEGAESLVMQGFPWDQYVIHVLTIERPRQELRQMLMQHGYHFLRTNSNFNDTTWIHQSLPQFSIVNASYANGAPLGNTSCMQAMGHPWPENLQM